MGPRMIFDYFLIDGPTWVFPSIAVNLHMGSSDYYGKNIRHGLQQIHKLSFHGTRTEDTMTIIILTTKTNNQTQKEMRLGLECSGEDREQRRGGKKGSGDTAKRNGVD